MQNRQDIGTMIEVTRKKKNITQEQLAEMAGITRNNLSRIENGLYSPGLDILLKLSNALGTVIKFDAPF